MTAINLAWFIAGIFVCGFAGVLAMALFQINPRED